MEKRDTSSSLLRDPGIRMRKGKEGQISTHKRSPSFSGSIVFASTGFVRPDTLDRRHVWPWCQAETFCSRSKRQASLDKAASSDRQAPIIPRFFKRYWSLHAA